MIKPVKKIIIVGGGSAGWMSAAALIKAYPEKEIVVIESPNVPIVGVGESTLGGINDYCKFLEIDEKDFMTFTDASYKMSIKFTDFYEKDAGGFHYPFGRPLTQGTINGMNDWLVKKALYPDTPIGDYVNCFFPAAALWDHNKFALNNYGLFDNYEPDNDVAYHFDATKFGAWLRERYCKPRGVKHIPTTVIDIKVNENGVEKLVLESGDEISADLYVDCTGFKSILLAGALKEEFVSYSNMLPNNKAIATRIPYKDKEKELEPFTNSTAIGNGWVWNIPSWERLGTGYVYSDKFITPKDAREEFKQHLMSDKMVVPRTREEVDALEFNDVYNAATFGMWRNFAQFVAMHYALSIRDDTEYWKANANRVYSPGMPSLEPETAIGFYKLQGAKMFEYGHDSDIAGINWISVGMNYFVSDKTTVTLRQNLRRENFRITYDPIFRMWEERKARWNESAKNYGSLYQYLKDNIHKGQE